MDDENSGNSESNITPMEKQYLIEFIKTRQTYPELWNTSIETYRDKVKKNSALKKAPGYLQKKYTYIYY